MAVVQQQKQKQQKQQQQQQQQQQQKQQQKQQKQQQQQQQQQQKQQQKQQKQQQQQQQKQQQQQQQQQKQQKQKQKHLVTTGGADPMGRKTGRPRGRPTEGCAALTPRQRRLVERYDRLAAWVLHRRHAGLVALVGWDDAHQHARLALALAARTFRPRRGARFITHAATAIDLRCRRLYLGACGYRETGRGRAHDPTLLPARITDELAAALPARGPDPRHEDAAAAVAATLAATLAPVPARLRRAVELRYGLADGRERTLAEVGRALGGLSRERARQILLEALAEARAAAIAQGGLTP